MGVGTDCDGAINRFTAILTDNTTAFTWERDKDFGSGFTFCSSGTGGYSLASVPEPSTVLLLCSGLTALAASRRLSKA